MIDLDPCVQVLTPLQGGLPQQTGVIIQPQQIVLASGNKVTGNTQVSSSRRRFDRSDDARVSDVVVNNNLTGLEMAKINIQHFIAVS